MAGTFNIKVSRGGRFYNPGYAQIYSIGDFKDLVRYLSDRLFIDEDQNVMTDSDGKVLFELEDDGSIPEIGEIDFDGDYERYYTIHIDDASEWEIKMLCRAIIDQYDYIDDIYILEKLVDDGWIQEYIVWESDQDTEDIIEKLLSTYYNVHPYYQYIDKSLIKKLLDFFEEGEEYIDVFDQFKEDYL